eukprot:TRINITY_DN5631_c0_g1_i1.p1 TRINITY_DN5631_c0_g1~~TRINITY_DN5631_c0_g1_i1.p1  ORF type:complete len:145 (-),score=38.43 TRINITY_DN5631_c0_g1_i1:95-529(-)
MIALRLSNMISVRFLISFLMELDGAKKASFRLAAIRNMACLGSQRVCGWDSSRQKIKVASLDGQLNRIVDIPNVCATNLVRCRGRIYNFTTTGYTVIIAKGVKQKLYKTKGGKEGNFKLKFSSFKLAVTSDEKIILLAEDPEFP